MKIIKQEFLTKAKRICITPEMEKAQRLIFDTIHHLYSSLNVNLGEGFCKNYFSSGLGADPLHRGQFHYSE